MSSTSLTDAQLRQVRQVFADTGSVAQTWRALVLSGDQYAQAAYQVIAQPDSPRLLEAATRQVSAMARTRMCMVAATRPGRALGRRAMSRAVGMRRTSATRRASW